MDVFGKRRRDGEIVGREARIEAHERIRVESGGDDGGFAPERRSCYPETRTGISGVWDLAMNACSCELVPEVGVAVRSVSVAPDGSLVVAGNSTGTCYVWRLQKDAKTTAHFEPLHKLRAHPDEYVLKCLISPDVRSLATTSSDKTVKLWNLDGLGLERTLNGHSRWVWDCVFSVDLAYLVTASSDGSARLWDCSSGEAIRVYNGHHKAVVCVRVERLRRGCREGGNEVVK